MEGQFNGGFFALRVRGAYNISPPNYYYLRGLIHGGAYFRNFTVPNQATLLIYPNQQDNCTMTSFYYNYYQNAVVCFFLLQIKANHCCLLILSSTDKVKNESKTNPILVLVVKYCHHENGLFLFHPILVGVVGEYAYYTPNNEPHGLKLNKMLTVAIAYIF